MKFFLPVVLFLALVFGYGKVDGQTINPPTIDCVSTDENTGDVTISFTPAPLDPCGAFVSYTIHGATSLAGPYLVIATIPNPGTTSYVHTGANGTILDWYYYITMEQNCPGSTSPPSATVTERILDIPEIEYLTVTPAGVEIHWFPLPANSATQDVVIGSLDKNTGLYVPLATVPAAPPVYLDATNDPNGDYLVYSIKGLDDCSTQSIYSDSAHNTIHITATVDNCAQNVTIAFNRYSSWPGDVALEYLLESSIDNASPTYTSLGQPFPAGSPAGAPTSYIYDVAGLTGTDITFRVAAVHPDGVKRSYSNMITLPLNILKSTAYNYISYGSVTDTNVIDIAWIIDTVADVKDFVIKRSTDGITFTDIDSMSADSNDLFERFYTDSTANTATSSYYYQVDSRDTCGFTLNSTIVHTIFLTAEGKETENRLNWNKFELPNVSVLSYTVFRMDNDSVPIALETVLPSVLNYEEQIADVISENGLFCYMIEARCVLTLPDVDVPFREFTTRSNIACADKDPVIWIPNAFVPNGVNTSFRPVLLFGVDQYDFRIYDRWGKEVFVTNNFTHGWDGTHEGERMPLGGYVYQLHIVSATGEVFDRRGVVALIR
jgi:gliding motility-associated-like protein